MRTPLSILIILLWLILAYFYWDSSQSCCSDSIEPTSTIEEDGKISDLTDENLDAVSRPLLFKWGQSLPKTGNGWTGLKSNIVDSLGTNQVLEIIGLYSEKEPNNTTFDNLGLARANEVRKLFNTIPDKQIRLVGELNDSEIDTAILFEACDFDYKMNTASVKEIEDKTRIYFPFNSTNKLDDAEIEKYLDNVAERVIKSNERIILIGHTDNIGSTQSNIVLGQKRADIVKNYLISKGVDSSKIDATSVGEAQPLSDNSTSTGRALNRRTELQIIN
jgi:outer membrane protein OmpA-like peptidoglycan-associated protein